MYWQDRILLIMLGQESQGSSTFHACLMTVKMYKALGLSYTRRGQLQKVHNQACCRSSVFFSDYSAQHKGQNGPRASKPMAKDSSVSRGPENECRPRLLAQLLVFPSPFCFLLCHSSSVLNSISFHEQARKRNSNDDRFPPKDARCSLKVEDRPSASIMMRHARR
jgi:hypothetical protein